MCSASMYTQTFLDWRHLGHITRQAKKDTAPTTSLDFYTFTIQSQC